MDEEVKRRRKEKEKQAEEQRLAEERMRKMEQENKHLLANLFSQKPVLNQSLAQSLAQSQILKQKLSMAQSPLQRTGIISQLQRMQAACGQPPHGQPPHGPNLLSLQRNANHTQQMTHKSWPSSASPKQGAPQNPHAFSPFYPQSFLSSFPQLKNPSLPLHQTTRSPGLSSKNPLDEILDLTSRSPSPDSTEGGMSLDALTGPPPAFTDDFSLESLISQSAPIPQHGAQVQQPLLQQQQQHHHSLLVNNHPDLLDLLDLPPSPQIPSQKDSPSSSASSCSSSTASSSSVVSHVSAGLLPASTLNPTSMSSSLFGASSSSSSLFSNSSSHFPPSYLLSQPDPLPLHNGHCSSGALDVREALSSMLQAGPDRKSVIHYRQQD